MQDHQKNELIKLFENSTFRFALEHLIDCKQYNRPHIHSFKMYVLENAGKFVALKDIIELYLECKSGLKSANIDECPACECDPCDCYEWSGGVP